MTALQNAKQGILNLLTLAGISANRWIINRSDSLDHTVWLCGDGRSGTTWLANIINHANQYRLLFEPLHPVLGLAKQATPEYRYLHPDTVDTAYYRLLHTTFLGRASSRFVEMYNKRFIYKHTLVKDIYSHLHIKWADVHFPQVKKIVIIRNPFSVAVSKQRLHNCIWLTDPESFLKQRPLVEEFLDPFRDLISQKHGYIESHVLIWSIVHYVLFKQGPRGNIHWLFFEELRHDYDNAVKNLFQFLYRSTPDAATYRSLERARRTPSETSFSSATVQSTYQETQSLTQQERENCEYILRRFGLDALYSNDGRPNREFLTRLIGQ